jgi:hypothetical protein
MLGNAMEWTQGYQGRKPGSPAAGPAGAGNGGVDAKEIVFTDDIDAQDKNDVLLEDA